MRYGSFMSTITLKNVPLGLHEALKSQAKTHGRSLNKEILCSLEQMIKGTPMDANQILREAQVCREEMNVYMTQRELKAMKEEGRA
jgi:plasmid stability protein